MSEKELLNHLTSQARSLPLKPVDLTAGVMKSIHNELEARSIDDNALEQESVNIFYWASGISIAAAVILIVSLSLYFSDISSFADYSVFNLLVPMS